MPGELTESYQYKIIIKIGRKDRCTMCKMIEHTQYRPLWIPMYSGAASAVTLQ